MRITEFKYLKDTNNLEDKKVLILKESDTFIEGIDLSKIEEAKREEILSTAKKLEEMIKEVTNISYRKYLKNKIY